MLVQLKEENERKSWGEIAPLDPFSPESYAQAKEQLLEKLARLIQGDFYLGGLFSSVHFGIESALTDLICPSSPPPLSTQALLSGSLEEIYSKGLKIRNYPAVKIKVGHLEVAKSIPLVKELLPLLPKKIRIDANQKWSYDQGMAFANSFAPDTFDYFEEPFVSFKDYASFPYPIALDETIRSAQIETFFKLATLKALVIKPTLMGGCSRLIPFLRRAQKKGIAFILSSSYESELGIGLIAKIGRRLQVADLPMGLDTCSLFKEPLFKERIICREGRITFPKAWRLTGSSYHHL